MELHQFRIEAHAGQIGQPMPEGPHRDGVDWVLVVNRKNVERGVTMIYGLDHSHLGDCTLTDPLDAVFLQDHRVFHHERPKLLIFRHAARERPAQVKPTRQRPRYAQIPDV